MQLEKIKKLKKSEVKTLVDLILTGMAQYITTPLYKSAKLRSLSSKENNFIILKSDTKSICGFLMYRIVKENIYIYEIHVAKEFQSKGFGKAMIENLINEGKKLILCVYKENKGAQKLYRSLGFNVVYESDRHYEMEKYN